jgi:hypothetical protein
MDFSVLKSEEKIKPFANYTNPSPIKNDKSQKYSIPFLHTGVEKINFKENNGKTQDGPEKSYTNNTMNTLENNKLSSFDLNKISDRNGGNGIVKSSENLMGEKGAKINDNDVVFKNENEYTLQEICRICENDFVKTASEKKNWFTS